MSLIKNGDNRSTTINSLPPNESKNQSNQGDADGNVSGMFSLQERRRGSDISDHICHRERTTSREVPKGTGAIKRLVKIIYKISDICEIRLQTTSLQ